MMAVSADGRTLAVVEERTSAPWDRRTTLVKTLP
jgi:hypothetical protein